jgi:hypothetical protein
MSVKICGHTLHWMTIVNCGPRLRGHGTSIFNAPGSTALNVLSAVPEITNRDAFANFKTLFTDVSLNTEMGMFLNYCPWDPAGAEPNENFGREAMQLFTIGPDLLNQDGTPILDANGRPQPSYTSNDIEAVSRAVTGLTAPYDVWNSTDTEGTVAMIAADATQHDTNAKTLLGNTLPGGQDAITDTLAAVDVLTDHPNTAPHISAYLIHEFVTSNPTPAYVARVASVWADNGKGVRGDIAAVIKAILLDPEARAGDDPTFTESAEFGRFRDSVNFGSTIIRALNAGTPTTHTWGAANVMSDLSHEPVFSALSVFGCYVQNFTIPNTGLLAPESQIYTADAIAARADFVYNLLFYLTAFRNRSAGKADCSPRGSRVLGGVASSDQIRISKRQASQTNPRAEEIVENIHNPDFFVNSEPYVSFQ